MNFRTALHLLASTVLVAVIASCSKTDTASKAQPEPVAQTETQQAQPEQTQKQAEPVKQEPAPQLAPDAVMFAVADLDGNTHQATEWIGKGPVVINFWGTWCGPCRREIPDLVKVYDEYKAQGIQLISFAVNDNVDQVREYVSQAGMNWVHLMAVDQTLTDFGVTTGIPTTIFLDKTGHEVNRFVGMQGYEEFKQAFADLVARQSS